ncbi:type II toxin-antitoxin system PemK/MazF family toxin [Sulfurimonas sediminis]|uniref:mRNA interferase n=1 Tax=Sulfurimonas sediminis TaxID=2590020 RepID=A0A7M1AZ62_9BACT|nr:type II toxin-antitoxin system PemK/MazF family toxin [Sulfurimonas sediminis]QOP42596.1 type II toxin-antitoxin system PemK/MazF family toxin [Sulfurimonas sediminis]
MFKRGSVYLAKTRPVLIIQTDLLNATQHTTVTILPLTTQLIDNSYPLRYRLKKREKLQQTSEILCDQIRTIDINRLATQAIATLTQQELYEVEEQVKILLDFS